MPLFTVVSPYTVKIDAGNLHDAMKSFVKQYYHLKINDFIVKDYMNHYKANLKYFNRDGRRRVGISINPWTGPIVPGPLISQNVLHYTPPMIARVVREKDEDDDKKEAKPKDSSSKKDDDEEVVRRFYAVSPVASPVLPALPVAGPLSPFNTKMVARPVTPVLSPTFSLGPITPPTLFGQRVAMLP